MLDVLYIAFNRLAYTRETFEALIANTQWQHVARLFVHDDGSTDGTREYLEQRCAGLDLEDTEIVFHGLRVGGPVAATNWYLDQPLRDDVDRFAKIDNDLVVCPGWLGDMLRQLTLHPELDILGMEPMTGHPRMPPREDRTVTDARFIGGKGILRLRAFEGCRPVPHGQNGYHGFSQWQFRHPAITKGWITPDLPVFGLDQLPFDPWRSLAVYYEQLGWQRLWDAYDALDTSYWDWWRPVGDA